MSGGKVVSPGRLEYKNDLIKWEKGRLKQLATGLPCDGLYAEGGWRAIPKRVTG